MYHIKTGYPEEGELVMCKITKIHYNSVFADLNEYQNRSGMIHISEIAPGRIRNIRDYVKEGKMVVCKVLRINHERGHIDLTLRRVTDRQRRSKVEELKRGQLSEKILEFVASKLKKDSKQFYEEVNNKIDEHYESLYAFFEAVVNDEVTLKELGFSAQEQKLLEPVIRQRVAKPEVSIIERVNLSCSEADGVEKIKKAFHAAKKKGNETTAISYEGAGHYKIMIKAPDYREAEGVLAEMNSEIENSMSKLKCTLTFERLES